MILIYDLDLEELTSLSALRKNINDLTELWLSENQISDISPLVSLANLEEVSLGENPMSSTSINVHLSLRKEEWRLTGDVLFPNRKGAMGILTPFSTFRVIYNRWLIV